MCPAVGQGALAVETRADNGTAQQLAAKLEDRRTRIAVTAERAVLASLGGGCQVPIGAHATVAQDGSFHIRAIVVSPDGTEIIRKEASGDGGKAEEIGQRLGDSLLAAGGRKILEAVYGEQTDQSLRT